MHKNDVKNALMRIVENTDDGSLRQMLELLNDFTRCSEHGKAQICDEAFRIAAEDKNEPILVTFPPKYRGKHEDLVERIAQKNRQKVLTETMVKALELEKIRESN